MADERSVLDRLQNKAPMRKSDIELPNRRGTTDPRLAKPDVGGAFRKAAQGLKSVRSLGGKR